jgi:hypothetical protein
MNDTPLAAERRFQRLLIGHLPEEGLRMGSSMFDASKQVVVSPLEEGPSEVLGGDLRKGLFLRFCGHELNETSKNKILKMLGVLEGATS